MSNHVGKIMKMGIEKQDTGIKRKYDLEAIKKLEVNLSNQYKEMKPVIKIGDSVFAVNGDISFVSGLPKAGKSTITRFMIATALMQSLSNDSDTISIRSEYCEGRKVIYLDTEQNPSDTKRMIGSILEIAGLEKQPENFIALNLREFSHTENRDYLDSLFYYYNDAYLWIIDGITDFLPSANDETAGNEIIRYLMKMSSINNTCIVCLIHENSGNGNGKMRGHIGSEAARKCQGAISISYEDDKKVHSIKSTYFRGSKKIDPIFWQFDEYGKPVSCDADMIENFKKVSEDKELGKSIELIQILEKIYKNVGSQGLTSDVLKSMLLLHVPTPKANSKDPQGASKKSRDRLFNTIRDKKILRTQNEIIDGIQREVYYYDNPNLSLKF